MIVALATIGALTASTSTPSSAAPAARAQSDVLGAPQAPPSSHPNQRAGYRSPGAVNSAALAVVAAPAGARTWGAPGSVTTLVVYDTTDTYGWLGELYAIASGNLATHFGTVTAEPVVDYVAGQVSNYSATIYLGSTYNEPIPIAFLDDVLVTTRPVMWAGYNIWQLSGTPGSNVDNAFVATHGWDPSTSYFDSTDKVTEVAYQGQVLTRNPSSGPIIAPHITGPVTVLGQAQCGTATIPTVCDSITQTPTGSTTFPWAIRSANLTYLGEIPLSYNTEADRYLAFSDLMFSVLAPSAPAVHQALVRLEDVSPGIDTPAQLMAAADYLSSVNVPFSVAVIPEYTDPNGYYNGGVPQKMNIGQVSNATISAFDNALRYMASKGGTIIEHGLTHQYSNIDNPYTAVSADDFEFYRGRCSSTQNPPYAFDTACPNSDWIVQTGVLPNDSTAWAQGRAATGQQLFSKAGLVTPTIWETPHYSASAADYVGISNVFGTKYEREQFFGGQLTGVSNTQKFGQFYPYVVHDPYGATVLPENLGNFAPDAANHNPPRPPSVIIANAQAELAVRQGVASFFFHPYFDVSYLRQIVEGIQNLGYSFVGPADLLAKPPVPAVVAVAPSSGPAAGGTRVTISGSGLGGATGVDVGARSAKILYDTAATIVVATPPGLAGPVDVTVTTSGGTSAAGAADVFTYVKKVR